MRAERDFNEQEMREFVRQASRASDALLDFRNNFIDHTGDRGIPISVSDHASDQNVDLLNDHHPKITKLLNYYEQQCF